MKGILLFVLLLALGIGATFDEDYDLPGEWKDYDNFYDYGMVKEEAEKVLPKSNEDTQIDQRVEDDIEKYKNEEFHDIDTNYQIEDNRSDADKEHSVEDKEKSNELDLNDYNLLWGEGEIKDIKVSQENTEKKDEESVIDEEIYKDPKAVADNDYHLLWGDDDIAPAPISEENDSIKDELDIPFEADDEKDASDEAIPEIPAEKVDENILKETLELLSADENDGNDLENLPLPVPGDENLNEDILKETKDILDDVDNMESVPEDIKQNIEDIVDETKKLLEEGDSPNEENIPEQKEENLEDEIAKLADEIDKAEDRLENSDDDTVDDAMDNLNEDLDKLFDTLDKLKEGIEEAGGKAQQKIEKVFGSDENDLFDDDNDDIYENIEDSNLSEIFGKSNTHSSEESVEEDADDNMAKENLDDVIKEILEEEDKINSSFEKENPDENKENASKEDNDESMQDEKPIMYQNDALLDGDSKQDDSLVEQFNADVLDKDLADESSNENLVNEDKEKEKITDSKPKINMVDELTSEELDVLMEQFKLVHSDDLEIKSEPTPIHIKLSVDEPVVITSPNYPNPYPTNNVIDWMFEGDGTGIEFIIHDFAVNGALGDYLLVKPGGIDESGQDGLVFSYRLNSERKYRFMDVNRMFVRFNANLGMMFLRGFQFSVRMISPPSALEDINPPQPEELLVPHEENFTLILGGLSIIDFHDVKEDFRQILADMADRYVSENNIDPGLNTTSEVTKIIKTAVCNIRWPNYDKCVMVTFAVPLQYNNESADYRLNEEDLKVMWRAFYNEEPFITRLSQLSIAEFVIPNSRTAMTAWSVIAFGVLISVAMLAFGLWRYSCFEDYTRMRAFDNDSVQNEKRTLDLYPTPHQTLPPLYAESEYKWHDSYDDSTRVDMGGFANKSYIRDELYGFDSDEDVVHTRERGLEFNPRDSDV